MLLVRGGESDPSPGGAIPDGGDGFNSAFVECGRFRRRSMERSVPARLLDSARDKFRVRVFRGRRRERN